MKLAILFSLTALALSAQPAINFAGTPVKAGTPATITATLAGSSGANITALEFFVNLPAGVTAVSATPGIALGSGKQLTCQMTTGTTIFGCVVWGGISVLSDGGMASITFTSPTGPVSVAPTGLLGANAAADSPGVTIAAGPPIGIVTSPCDVNGDGKTDNTDVIAVITQALGAAPKISDINGDGRVDIIDVVRVAIAAGGGACSTRP